MVEISEDGNPDGGQPTVPIGEVGEICDEQRGGLLVNGSGNVITGARFVSNPKVHD